MGWESSARVLADVPVIAEAFCPITWCGSDDAS